MMQTDRLVRWGGIILVVAVAVAAMMAGGCEVNQTALHLSPEYDPLSGKYEKRQELQQVLGALLFVGCLLTAAFHLFVFGRMDIEAAPPIKRETLPVYCRALGRIAVAWILAHAAIYVLAFGSIDTRLWRLLF